MSPSHIKAGYLLAAGLVLAPALAVVAVAQEQALPANEQPLAPEHNPPGDIPDNQLFVDFASPLGFAVQVPEGWARRDLPNGAQFADKYGRITVTEEAAGSAPKVDDADQTLVPHIQSQERAVEVTKVTGVTLTAGPAVRISYGSNSDPNPVTNKAIRLENDRYYFWRDGKLVILDLSAPAGADNVDQWNLMANSFRWQ